MGAAPGITSLVRLQGIRVARTTSGSALRHIVSNLKYISLTKSGLKDAIHCMSSNVKKKKRNKQTKTLLQTS